MFYDNLNALCKSKGLTVTSLLKELNVSTSKGTAWKNGSVPKGDILSKLATYFGVSTDYLLGNTNNPQSSKTDEDPQTAEAIELYKALTDENRELVLQMMKGLLKK